MVLSIRFKRQARRVPEYLDRQEVTKILDQIDGRLLVSGTMPCCVCSTTRA